MYTGYHCSSDINHLKTLFVNIEYSTDKSILVLGLSFLSPSSLVLYPLQLFLLLFNAGFSNATDQSFGSTIMIVYSTLSFAVGYFLTKFFTCSLWFGFLHRFKSIGMIMREATQKHYSTERGQRGCIQNIIAVLALV
jgi:hypothetical protein